MTLARRDRAFEIAVIAALLFVSVGSAPGRTAERGQGWEPEGPLEALLAEREAEMGRRVAARLRPGVLERMAALVTPQAIGDSRADLVYTPIEPCRIFDTRVPTAGIMVASTPRAFLAAGTSALFPNQGGRSGGCGVPVGATAVMVNLAATASVGPGNLRAISWSPSAPVFPLAAVLNYGNVAGLAALANGIALPLCDPAAGTCVYDLYLQAFVSDTHAVADVVGYFSSVKGVLKSAAMPLAVSGSTVSLSPTGCAAGYVWKWTGAGWSCQADANTTYSAGSGLDLAGTTFSVDATDFNAQPTGSFSAGAVDFTTTWTTVAAQSITTPVPGRVLAIAASHMYLFDGYAFVEAILTGDPVGTTGTPTQARLMDAGQYAYPVQMMVFSVAAGTTSVYWRARVNGGTASYVRCRSPQIALVFIPS